MSAIESAAHLVWRCPSCDITYPTMQTCFRVMCPAKPDRYAEGIQEGRAAALREAADYHHEMRDYYGRLASVPTSRSAELWNHMSKVHEFSRNEFIKRADAAAKGGQK